MQTILVLNPKGGSGKSTLAINLAGFFACWGVKVAIADFDTQASVLDWLNARPATLPVIEGIAAHRLALPLSRSADYLILDVPSGLHGEPLVSLIQQADRIIVPVMPSPHDIRATQRFLDWIATYEDFESVSQTIGVIANRVKPNTRSFKLLTSFLHTVSLPCVGVLRDTQNYVLAAQHGFSIFELPGYKVRRDLRQWQRLINWMCVNAGLSPEVPVKPHESTYQATYRYL